jgi:hypothetical protein
MYILIEQRASPWFGNGGHSQLAPLDDDICLVPHERCQQSAQRLCPYRALIGRSVARRPRILPSDFVEPLATLCTVPCAVAMCALIQNSALCWTRAACSLALRFTNVVKDMDALYKLAVRDGGPFAVAPRTFLHTPIAATLAKRVATT